MRAKRTYYLLKRYGFSALKALEITIDAQREARHRRVEEYYAMIFVQIAFKSRHTLKGSMA